MADNFELLQQAIERNTPVALMLPSAGLVKPFRSRLLSASAEGIVLESVAGEADAIDALVRSEQPVVVSFRSDTQRVEFSGRILKRERGYRLNADTEVEVLHLPRPETVKAVQRRNDYRVTVPSDAGIEFSFHRVSEQDDLSGRPPAGAEMVVDVRDFSAGGLGGTWRRKPNDPPSIVSNQRLRIEVSGLGSKIVIDSRVRFQQALPDPSLRRVGIQFTLAPNNLQDRQKMTYLNKLLGELQRMELRRKKLAR